MIKNIRRLLALTVLLTVMWTAAAGHAQAAASVSDADAPAHSEGGGVYLIGEPVGVRLYSDGVIVSDTAGVITENGTVFPARDAGVQSGDIITGVDGARLYSSEQLVEAVERSGGDTLRLSVTRSGGTGRTIDVTPRFSSADGRYRIGIWVRDGTAGIGIVTFLSPGDMAFGAVGHSLGDDVYHGTEACAGVLNNVTLTGIRKGARGAPGELVGYLGTAELGTVSSNCPVGIFGTLADAGALRTFDGRLYQVARRSEVTEGPAQLLVRLPDQPCARLYDIEIERINGDRSDLTRNMMIKVNDRALLKAAGGIVQGMSGSPIIQNGRFAAAVTHVFVSDPTRGYAVFAENMMDYTETLQLSA